MRSSAFVSNFRKLFSGAVTAQLLFLCTLPVLSALYEPAQFGQFAVVLAVSNVLGIMLALRYEMAIVMPYKIQDAFLLMLSTHLLAVFVSVLVAVVMYFLISDFWVEYLGFHSDILMLSFLGFSYGAFSLFLYKIESYALSAFLSIAKVVSIFAFQCLFVGSGDGLILGQLFGSLLIFIVALCGALFYFKRRHVKVSLSRMYVLLRRHRRFPMFSLPAGLMNSLGSNMPVILVDSFLGGHAAGLFSMASKLVLAPVGLIASNVNNVFVQEVRKRIFSRQAVYGFMWSIVRMMTAVGGGIVVVLGAFVWLQGFEIFLGDDWRGVGGVVILLLPITMASMVSTSVARFSLFERHDLGLYFQCAVMFVSLGSILLGSYLFSDAGGVYLLYSLSMSLVFIWQVSISLMLAKENDA